MKYHFVGGNANFDFFLRMWGLMRGIVETVVSGLHKKVSVLFLGIDGAGKTTLVEKILTYLDPTRKPKTILTTMGLNVENVEKGSIKITFRDLAGKPILRNLWHQYINDANVMIYVVNGDQMDRIHESRKAFDEISTEFHGSIAFVFLKGDKSLIDFFPTAALHTRFFLNLDEPKEIELLYNYIASKAE